MLTATFTITAYTGTGQQVLAAVYPNVISYKVDVANNSLTLNFAGGYPSITFDLTEIEVFNIAVNEGNQIVNVNGSYNDKVISDEANHYWRLNESSGTDAIDSADSLDGVISGGVTLGATGFVNNDDTSMSFDGTDGTIDMDNSTIAAPLTMECWFKLDTASGFPMVLSFSDPLDSENWCQLYIVVDPSDLAQAGTYLSFDYSIALANYYGYANYLFTTGVPYHVVVVIYSDRVQCYVNGQPIDNATFITPIDFVLLTELSLPFHIGSDDGEQFFWDGNIGEAALYNRALTAAEVLNHYNAKKIS